MIFLSKYEKTGFNAIVNEKLGDYFFKKPWKSCSRLEGLVKVQILLNCKIDNIPTEEIIP
jgi:hypothetical protein